MIKTKFLKCMESTKFLISNMIISTMILLILAASTLATIKKGEDYGAMQREYRNLAGSLILKSNDLTYEIINFVTSKRSEYLDNYWYRRTEAKNLEKVEEALLEMELDLNEEEMIRKMMASSKMMMEIQEIALKHMEKGDTASAERIVLSHEYDNLTYAMQEDFDLLKELVTVRLDKNKAQVLKVSYIEYSLIGIVIVWMFIISMFILMKLSKAKKELNIDQLTGLQNRNVYREKMIDLIQGQPDKFGALILCDIDNLKFINDCYGHNNGDHYIQSVAKELKVFDKYHSVLSRPSGDEFVIYIHGFDSKEEVMQVVEKEINSIKNEYFITTMCVEEKIRFSTGVSIYPIDSESIDHLISYSDYAMYNIKKSSKGEIEFYDKITFDKSTFLLTNRGYLDEFLEKELLDFAMQPIVDANTLEIYGYEALMRPQAEILNNPFLVLQLGKDESKLDKVERLVFKKVLEKIDANIKTLKDTKIFVNSISNQILSRKELEKYMEQYPYLFRNIVLEVTEQEYVDEDLLKVKTDMFREYGASIALDDYGSGYSNDRSLLSQLYDIIKIDMELVRDIDTDPKRQELVKSILKVSAINNYKVVAEGVETEEEAKKLRSLGVHYLQGYFLAKPNLEIKGLDASAIEKLK